MATSRRLAITYARTEGGRPRSIELIPRHLSLRENGWLLVADDPAKRRSHTIRLDQIKEAGLSERKGGRSRAAGRKDAAAHVGTGLRVKLRLRPPLTALAADGHLPEGLQIEHGNGGVFLIVSHATGMWELLGWLLSFGPSIEVIEPVALRSELKRVAAELLALYGTGT
jgi:predicted DNA-binding transcriptional regulator YafY